MRSPSRKAYTLLEIVVVAGIFIFIAAMVLANYRGANRDQQLMLAAEQVSASMRLAKAKAMSNAAQNICDADGTVCRTGSTCAGSCSNKYVWQYGMKFGTDGAHTQYAIGADYNADGAYASGEVIPGGALALPYGFVFDSFWPGSAYDIIFAYNAANSSPFGCKGSCVRDIIIRDPQTGHRVVIEYVSWADNFYTYLQSS